MTKTLAVVGAVVALLSAGIADAQYVREQSKFIGPCLGLNLESGSSALYYGANFEYMTKRDMGIGGYFRYFSYVAQKYADGGTYEFGSELFVVDANYHFKVPQTELDPFAGVGIGYIFSQGGYKNTTNTFGNPPASNASFVFDILVGARYFLTDKFAGVGRLAFGPHYNALEIGLDISL